MVRRWSDLTEAQRRTFVAMGVVQVVFAGAAWTDLALRPREFVRGRKAWWALAILVNFAGPLAYFRWGRRT
ncbi:PLDc N-terminal domain-containing protein [Lentzea flaviverrucosa]|uniref:Phospholipase_D-nuclease N-terminal n=1 Tax=Lentzea flaviverrucosa TaxID=200379 RepID=A0A1H9XXY1_9PSEU|nr:PLDc N-terminal domain-containing protein [Lentzea flaviverrucosa]RDI34296.1 phospholipase D-like protein [Lentzea flaviverrucosa]SES50533.1 Phospholipase_D-nuclease N-terminal [Lentzea flaviverrucosa]